MQSPGNTATVGAGECPRCGAALDGDPSADVRRGWPCAIGTSYGAAAACYSVPTVCPQGHAWRHCETHRCFIEVPAQPVRAPPEPERPPGTVPGTTLAAFERDTGENWLVGPADQGDPDDPDVEDADRAYGRGDWEARRRERALNR